MNSELPDYHIPDPVAAERGGTVVFWLLLGLAVATLAPCIILPEWRHYQSLKLAEQVQEQRVAQLEELVEREQDRLEAMRTDPGTVARLARRELNYRYEGEQTVWLGSGADPIPMELASPPIGPIKLEPVRPPELVERALAPLPELDYDNVFCEPSTRPLVMTMSVGLALTAFIIFRRPHADALSD